MFERTIRRFSDHQSAEAAAREDDNDLTPYSSDLMRSCN